MPTRADQRDDFTRFVDTHLNYFLRIARGLTADRDGADDLTQASLEKAYRSWGRVMQAVDPVGYVRRIMVNTCYDGWRRKQRFRELFGMADPNADLPPASWGDPASAFETHEGIDLLLEPLTARERAVVVLRHCADLSEAATAAELGIPLGTVKSTSARALSKLRGAHHLAGADHERP